MHGSGPIPFRDGIARVLTLAELQNGEAWPRAFQGKCKDHRYYELIERTLANEFEHRYMVLEDRSGKVRGVQPIFFVRQNLVEGVPGRVRTIVDFIRNTAQLPCMALDLMIRQCSARLSQLQRE